MGTDKRQRQKQGHRSRAEAARKAQAAAARRKRVANVGVAILVVAIAVAGFAALGNTGSDTADDTTTTSPTTAPGGTTTTAGGLQPATLTGPGAGAQLLGETPCPKADGSSERTTTFAEAPPMCIDESKTYAATVTTTKGEFVLALDAKAAPKTVNNFVVLARYHFYDGIPFHRIVPNFVIQAGDPSDTPTGVGGPGYTIGEEPPADKTYEKYDLAMAKTQEANSTGSQFFVVTGDPAALNSAGTYSLFGTVFAGREIVDAIGASPTAGQGGDSPTEQITIEKIVITEK